MRASDLDRLIRIEATARAHATAREAAADYAEEVERDYVVEDRLMAAEESTWVALRAALAEPRSPVAARKGEG